MNDTIANVDKKSVHDLQIEACSAMDVGVIPIPKQFEPKRWIVECLAWKRGKTIFCAILIFLSILGYGVYRTGSVKNTFNYLSGQRIFLSSESEDLGLVTPKSVLAIQVKIANFSSEKCTILGFGTSCGCLRSQSEFPIVLGPNETMCLILNLSTPSDYGQDFSVTATVYTSTVTDSRPTITLVGKTAST